jgi:hypothetical protein
LGANGSSNVLTGSYHNYFRIYDVNGDNDVVLQADKSAFKAKKIGGARGKVPGKKEGLQTENIDFGKKILHASWHPQENTIAVSGCRSRIESLLQLTRLQDCGNKQPVSLTAADRLRRR